MHFALNPQVVKTLVLRGFEEVGDLYWVNHVGIFSIPTRVATWMKIPLVVYGENPQFEYGVSEKNRKPQPMNERWRQEFGGLRDCAKDDLVTIKYLNVIWKFCDTLKIKIRTASLVYLW